MVRLAIMSSMLHLVCAGCGGGSCPEASAIGDCAASGLTPDTTTPVSPLELGGHCISALDGVSAAPGLEVRVHHSPGEVYRTQLLVVTSAAGWRVVTDAWAALGIAACALASEPDWSAETLVLAELHATGSTSASLRYALQARADGTPHVALELDFSFAAECDCLATQSLALLVRSAARPSVCAQTRGVGDAC